MRIERPMAAYKRWDIVKVPFPYTDRPVRERRPALVVGAQAIQERHGLLWVLMITSSGNRGWPGDVLVSDLEASGLPVVSVVRTAKIATIESKDAERIGSLPRSGRVAVLREIAAILPGAAPQSRGSGLGRA
jgi:mRNA interferase MazF